MDMKELSSILQQNGIVGAGGAGFPTYAKLDQRAETIILNCAECEPLLRLHRQLLEKYAREMVRFLKRSYKKSSGTEKTNNKPQPTYKTAVILQRFILLWIRIYCTRLFRPPLLREQKLCLSIQTRKQILK